MIKLEDFDLYSFLIDEKSNENILVYNISCKTLIDVKPLRIKSDKIDDFIRVYYGTSYLVSSHLYNFICSRIRYLIWVKSDITYAIFHNYAKIKVDLYNSLPLEKISML